MSNLSDDLAALRIDRDEPPRRGGALRTVLIGAVALALVGGAVVLALPAIEARVFKTEVAVTEVSRVSPTQASVDLTASGYVIGDRVAKIGADVPGRVTKVLVKEGQRVKAGDVLFEVDMVDQRASVAALRARAGAADARAVAAQAQADDLKRQLERDRALEQKNVLPKAQVDDLAARHETAEKTAKAAVAEARAAAADARTSASSLRHGTVSAPIDGMIIGRPPEVGDVLIQVAGYSPSFEIVDTTALLVEADVPEGRLPLAKPGAATEIVLDAQPDKRFRGVVHAITPRVNRSKATVAVKVRFVDVPEILFPEMAARVSFLQKPLDAEAMKAPPKTVVSNAAVVDRGGQKVVFVVEDGKVRPVPVVLGPAVGESVELKDGPPPGTRVVKAPPPTLVAGKSIKERTDG